MKSSIRANSDEGGERRSGADSRRRSSNYLADSFLGERNFKGEHAFKGDTNVAYLINLEDAPDLPLADVTTNDSTIWVFYAPSSRAKEIYRDLNPTYQPVGLTEKTAENKEEKCVYVRGPSHSWDRAQFFANNFKDKLGSVTGQTLKTRWVWFLRHCFSCSNGRDRRGAKRDAVGVFFRTLVKNSRTHLKNIFRRFLGIERLPLKSKLQSQLVRSKLINPFCEEGFLADSYTMGARLIQATENSGASTQRFFLYSSKLARAMQTALLVGTGLQANNGAVASEGLQLLPFIMEESNKFERWKLRQRPQVRKATQNVTTSKDACLDRNSLIEDFPLAGQAGNCKSRREAPIIVKDLASNQKKFFASEAFRSLRTADVGTNIVVTHGGFLRKLLLQTIALPDQKNPHPRNTEAFLCEIVSLVDEGNNEIVKAIIVRAQLEPVSNMDHPPLPPNSDTGALCQRIGSGSCEFFRDSRCNQGPQGNQTDSKTPESDLAPTEHRDNSYHSNRPSLVSAFPPELRTEPSRAAKASANQEAGALSSIRLSEGEI